MSLTRWDPWKELEHLRAETDRLWDQFLDKLTRNQAEPDRIAFLPDIDFVETPTEYRLYLSVPGLIEEDIDLTIDEHSLTVRGERQPPYDPSHAQCRLGEWRYGFFERRTQFPNRIRTDGVRASCDAGVLTIVLPKA
jgi:HSP20 family protein